MRRRSYAEAGVDLLKVRKMQRALAARFSSTFVNREGKAGSPLLPIGHYGGVIDLGGDTALTLHTDGVGSKVLVAQELRRFDTIGIDCVAMTVNDLVCLGSEPVALLDYIALEKENNELLMELAKGLAEGARRASVAIVGGETAIMGDVIKGKAGLGFDLVSMGVGLVKKDRVIDGSALVKGDAVLGVASSGLHSNGYTLARKVLRRRSLDERVRELGSTLGEALLEPTSIYARPVLEAIKESEVHGIGHITGGSFSKLTRLVGNRALGFDLALPRPPAIFSLIMDEGNVEPREMFRTFNMGIGLCLCLPETDVRKTAKIFGSAGFATYHLGTVRGGRGVSINGTRMA